MPEPMLKSSAERESLLLKSDSKSNEGKSKAGELGRLCTLRERMCECEEGSELGVNRRGVPDSRSEVECDRWKKADWEWEVDCEDDCMGSTAGTATVMMEPLISWSGHGLGRELRCSCSLVDQPDPASEQSNQSG